MQPRASHVGKGTVVTLYLPRAAVEEFPLAGNTAQPLDASMHGRATILVIGNVNAARCGAALYLRQLGYSVVDADDGLHALALCEAAQAFDLVAIDMTSPILDGAQVAKQLRLSHPRLPVLMIVEHSPCEFAAEDVLRWPLTQEELGASVLRLLGRKQTALALSTRIKHPAIRALYDAWHRNHSDIAFPQVEALDLEHCQARKVWSCVRSRTPFHSR